MLNVITLRPNTCDHTNHMITLRDEFCVEIFTQLESWGFATLTSNNNNSNNNNNNNNNSNNKNNNNTTAETTTTTITTAKKKLQQQQQQQQQQSLCVRVEGHGH